MLYNSCRANHPFVVDTTRMNHSRRRRFVDSIFVADDHVFAVLSAYSRFPFSLLQCERIMYSPSNIWLWFFGTLGSALYSEQISVSVFDTNPSRQNDDRYKFLELHISSLQYYLFAILRSFCSNGLAGRNAILIGTNEIAQHDKTYSFVSNPLPMYTMTVDSQ